MESPHPRIAELVLNAIDELNGQLPPDQQIPSRLDVKLLGEDASLDSLGLVNLIVLVEQTTSEEFGIPVTLADERAMSQTRSPFRTVENLIAHVASRLGECDVEL
jgi:acyl carrier protein